MGIRTDGQLPCGNQTLLRDQGMLNTHVSHIIVVLQSMLLGKVSANLSTLCRGNILVRHKVIHNKDYLLLIKYALSVNLIQLTNCHRSGDIISVYQIHLG